MTGGAPSAAPLRIAAFNVRNYFMTLGSRGASNHAERLRQRKRIVDVLHALDADVLALIEMENDPRALDDLRRALNQRVRERAQSYAQTPDPPDGVGADVIRVALLHRTARVRPIGDARSDRDVVHRVRQPMGQVYAVRDRGAEVAHADDADDAALRIGVVTAHFKSKRCLNAHGIQVDRGDGQGCWNPLRTSQALRALRLLRLLCEDAGTDHGLVIGDLNAYPGEDPIRVLERGGLCDLLAAHVPIDERHSYDHRGRRGYLDHALATKALAARVTTAAFWRPSIAMMATLPPSDHDPVTVVVDAAGDGGNDSD
ncbi:MAG: endonuclease/exonuclease/phosphatase family protein [Acidobacteriota bacterium]